jgi:acyl dehydratase
MQVRGASSGVNYGTGAIRFAPPVHTGDRIRARATVVDAAAVNGGVQVSVEIRVEAEGRPEPACVVESLSRWLR